MDSRRFHEVRKRRGVEAKERSNKEQRGGLDSRSADHKYQGHSDHAIFGDTHHNIAVCMWKWHNGRMGDKRSSFRGLSAVTCTSPRDTGWQRKAWWEGKQGRMCCQSQSQGVGASRVGRVGVKVRSCRRAEGKAEEPLARVRGYVAVAMYLISVRQAATRRSCSSRWQSAGKPQAWHGSGRAAWLAFRVRLCFAPAIGDAVLPEACGRLARCLPEACHWPASPA